MNFPKAGELWFRFDQKTKEDKYVLVDDIKGGSVFAHYISNAADNGTFYPSFARTFTDFTRIFRRKENSWV